MARSRNYCFTDFQDTDYEKLYTEYKDIIRYICFGKEICPKTGKKHIQGWIQLVNPRRFGGIKKLLGPKVHIEACRGSEYDNDKYCTKDGKYKTFGKFKTQGMRTDLEAIKKNIDDGSSRSEIIADHFSTYCRYRNGINDYINIKEESKRSKFREVEVEYIHGDTGTGKTRYGMAQCQYKITGDNLQWWDGYNGESSILIDEYDNNIPITKLLNILDGYKLRLPIKGGFTYANWTKVIITSNNDKSCLHPNAKPAHRKALFRRITRTIHFEKMARSAQGNTIT